MNGYGPTENTTFSVCHLINREYNDQVPIGKPISNSSAYIYDKGNNLVPIGVTGELCVGGDGVSRGYLNNLELTSERFIDNPYVSGDRLYCTGDLARWLPDGIIEFFGRIDKQVKIRGFRIELGEIENHLLKIEGIKEAVVIARDSGKGDKYLCGYIVLEKTKSLNIKDTRDKLSRYLPDYMIPAYFVKLDKIPLTPNGKIDRKALPNPEIRREEDYTAPRNEIELTLQNTWSEVLNIEKEKISIDSNFFELGGHSLKAIMLISNIHKEHNVRLPLTELFKHATIRELSKVLNNLKRERYFEIKPVSEKEYYTLSSAQKRLYFLHQMEPGKVHYNISHSFPIDKVINIDKLENIIKKLINRHESLRTSFHMINENPVQKIHRKVDFEIECFDISIRDPGIGEPQCSPIEVENVIKRFTRPFDLSNAPLLRVGIIKVESSNPLLLFDMHHIIADGTSLEILQREFLTLLSKVDLPDMKLQYKDYSEWQNSKEQGELIKEQEKYWLKEFSDERSVLNLPTDFSRPLVQSFEGAVVNFVLNAEETKGIKAITRDNDVTLFMVMLSIFNIFLSNLSGSNQEDIIVGTPLAGRRHADLYNIIGMFVNTLALRNSPGGDKSFKEFLDEVKQRTLEAYENQEYQFEDLVDRVFVKRDAGRNPIFDVMLNVLNQDEYESRGNISFDLDTESGYRHINSQSKFDVTLSVVDYGDHIGLSLNYCTKLFNAGTIERFIGYLGGIATQILRDADQKLSEIELITEGEKDQILYDFNNTEIGYLRDKTIHELFEEQVEKTPDHIAIVLNDENVSYRDLNLRANQLAKFLREKGATPDTLIGIMNERSVEIITGLIAIIKSGGAYLPIDKKYPEFRIKRTLIDNKVNLILFKETNCNYLKEICETIKLDRFDYHADSNANDIIENLNKPSDLVYVILTSGTTGYPNGVMIDHYNVVNLALTQRLVFNIEPSDRILQFSSLSFDASVEQIWITFLSGAGLVLIKEEVLLDKKAFEEYVIERSVTHIHAVPSYLNEMKVKNSGNLKRMVSGGDICPVGLAKRWYKGIDFYNEYGPTETTVTSIEKTVNEVGEEQTFISIGRPLGNTIIYILSKYMKVVPMGVVGELYIGGDGVSRGYLNNPELTRARFLDHPIISGCKMYKSGDLSRWLPNGDIEFLGRIDNQVKIRGFRIELGEIENQLLKIEGIKEAVVIERESERGDKYLCGYIVCDKAKSFDITGTREKLSENLPGYMIPTYFVELDKIPLVSSGKIDRKSLPVPGVNEGDNDVLPSNMIEEKLCDVWREVLGIESIGTQANFFEVGGDSIKAIQVSSRLQKYGLKLSIQDLFRYPRISDLSKYVKKMDRVIDQSPVSGEIPLTPIQKWFLRVAPEAQDSALPADQGKNSTNKEDCTCLHHFNQSVMLYKEDGFHEDILRAVFNKLTNHHDILRVVFKRDNGKIIQFNRGIDGKYYDMDIYDFNGESDVKSLILEKSQKIQSSINLYQGPLLKIGLFKTGEGDHLLIVIHHLVVDGVSWRIILEDLFKGYEQCLRGENIRLQDKTDSFKYWSEEQERYSESFRLSRELAYWKEVEEAEIKPLKRDFEPGESRLIAKNERVLSFVLEKESTDKLLRESNRAYNTEINDLLLASLALSIREWAGLETILINLEGHGREDIGIDVDVDISRTVGWFTSQCPVLLKIKKPEDLSYTIRDIKEVLRGIPNKGIGYGILRYLTPAAKKRGINFRSKPEISFNYLGEFVGEAIDNEVFNMSGMPQGSLQSPEMKSNYRININGMISGDQLSLSFSYNRYEYKEETINKLCSYYKRYLLEIIEHCNLKEEMVKTPSDLDYSEIDIDELEDIKNFVNQIE